MERTLGKEKGTVIITDEKTETIMENPTSSKTMQESLKRTELIKDLNVPTGKTERDEETKRNASKSGTISSFKTLIANLESTGLATKEELVLLTTINKAVKQRWIDSL